MPQEQRELSSSYRLDGMLQDAVMAAVRSAYARTEGGNIPDCIQATITAGIIAGLNELERQRSKT